jgi:acetyl-CoA C-acetyltransferase
MISSSDPIVIAAAARTPMGSFQGELKKETAVTLGSAAIREALSRAGIDGGDIDEVVMGCVLSAGLGQAPGRQAAIGGGVPQSVPASTLNKMCGSGMKAAMFATDLVAAGSANIVLAGGMESMTNAPYLLEKARGGYRIGHGRVMDHMMLDGLEDAYDRGRAMGTFAEDTAQHYQFTREAQDNYALESLARAQRAIAEGRFQAEIVAVDASTTDEQPGKARPEKIPHLKPAFRDGGTVTAANSSSISDGAAALIITRMSEAEKRGMTPLATIHGHASHAQEPNWFTTAPVFAMQKLLDKVGWTKDEVDLWEINEAFAVVPMAAIHELGISHDVVNINGGATALGHPIGASGARIMVTLLNALKANGLKRGVASLCIGGGEGTAMAVELV